jgi:hypothetical protein
MQWREFGRDLVETGDLDPVYVMLHGAQLEEDVLTRWLLAYWCFYDCGTASRIAESSDFWETSHQAYEEKWPRGSERRHFRGQQCLDSLASLKAHGAPEYLIARLKGCCSFAEVQHVTEPLRGFGPWITWKIADMVERVLEVPIDFSEASLLMYKEPVQGASLILGQPIGTNEMRRALALMQEEFGHLKAPPREDRLLNVQEYETIFCKYKSHVNGHYPRFKDSREIYERLTGLSKVSALCARLAPHVPSVDKFVDSTLRRMFV